MDIDGNLRDLQEKGRFPATLLGVYIDMYNPEISKQTMKKTTRIRAAIDAARSFLEDEQALPQGSDPGQKMSLFATPIDDLKEQILRLEKQRDALKAQIAALEKQLLEIQSCCQRKETKSTDDVAQKRRSRNPAAPRKTPASRRPKTEAEQAGLNQLKAAFDAWDSDFD